MTKTCPNCGREERKKIHLQIIIDDHFEINEDIDVCPNTKCLDTVKVNLKFDIDKESDENGTTSQPYS